MAKEVEKIILQYLFSKKTSFEFNYLKLSFDVLSWPQDVNGVTMMFHRWFKECTFSRHHDMARNWPRFGNDIMFIPRFLGFEPYLKDVMARCSSTFILHHLQTSLDIP